MMNDLFHRTIATDFFSFAAKFFQIVKPGVPYEENWHHHAMSALVDRLHAGDVRNALITMPPRCLKSYMMSVALPAFLLGRNPSTKIIVTSYTEQLAHDLAADTLRIMESPLYKLIFPDTALSKRTRNDLQTTVGGQRYATTVGGSVTGLGAEWIIVDDPLNASLAYSEAARKQANAYFDQTLSTRGDDPRTVKFIVVMQRLHEDDLAGHLLDQGGFEHLRLQARATEDADIDIGGGRRHYVREGDLLQENRLSEAELVARQNRLGSAAFAAQYQQDPVPADGNQIKREWLHRYSRVPAEGDGIIVQSWDTAGKDGVANDYSVCTTWLLLDGVSYLLDVWRDKVQFPALRDKVTLLYQRWNCTHMLIEDASSGTGLIQDLRVSSQMNIIRIKKPSVDKRARVDAISGALEAGKVLFPHEASWLATFEHEVLAFPGKRDDQVDSMTQYVIWAMERSHSTFFEFHFDHGNADMDAESIAHHIISSRRW